MFGFASVQRRLHRSTGLRLLVCTLTLPMLLASASRAEVILIHEHCGALHFHFFDAPHSHGWHHEHDRDHESVPCLCDKPDSDSSSRDDDASPRGLIIRVHELPRASGASMVVTTGSSEGNGLVSAPTCGVLNASQTLQPERPPTRARDDTGPSDRNRVCAILLANHALLL